jgi:glutaredoxin
MVTTTLSTDPCHSARSARKQLKLWLLILLCFASHFALGQTTTLYKSIGPDGKAVYSDRPAAGARDAKTLTFYNAPASPLSAETLAYIDQLSKSADARASSPSTRDAVLFSAVWCGYCKQAKAYLASKHVAYRELDIDTKDGLLAYARAGGKRGVPLLLANGQSVVGFSISAYDALLAPRN